MIISPPMLKNKSDSESDTAWLARMMPFDPNRGFPINHYRSWHGGIHITHSDSGGTPEKIRAIADATVQSVRQPVGSKKEKPPYHYNGATDCGYVLLKHETEIGSGANAKVVYYSLYMHLASIDAAVTAGAKIDRKDPLGTVGQVDGKNAVHFQIFCDDANVAKLTGRTAPELDISKNGRTDAVYGDMHFYLPAGTRFYRKAPANKAATTSEAEVYTSTEPLYVSMSFAKGQCAMLTRKKGVLSVGQYCQVGEKLVNADGADYEYNLHTHARKLYPQCPSAGFELLRFGRVINTGHETLVPADAPLWRTVSYPGGQGMVNLALPAIKKFSDGDFPHWTGWVLVNDDTGETSQCYSKRLLCRLGDDLQGMICHFPLEWDASTLETRLTWLKSKMIEMNNQILEMQNTPREVAETSNSIDENSFNNNTADTNVLNPQTNVWDEYDPCDNEMVAADWNKLIDHAKALCFDVAGLPAGRVWHFHPVAFVAHFRKCGWLDKEAIQAIMTSARNKTHYAKDIKKIEKAVSEHHIALNLAMRKYHILTPNRQSHFLGQGAVESDSLTTMQEVSQHQTVKNGKQIGGSYIPESIENA